jgi:hypothetical protein
LAVGWSALRHRGRTRWWIPRGPASVSAEALLIYQPVTPRGRVAWEAARFGARWGAFRLLPRGDTPPKAVREALAPYLVSRETFALARGNHPGRYVGAIIDRRGVSREIVKIATDAEGREALRREAEAIRAHGSLLPSPLAPPRVLGTGPGVLLMQPVAWGLRARPWELEPHVARAMGSFYRRGVRDGAGSGLAHGDFAPWNLLKTDRTFVLLDWESARTDAPAFFDLCHFLVQSYSLLGRPSCEQLLSGFRGSGGWVSKAIKGYAEGAELSTDHAMEALESYLRTSVESIEAGGHARRQLLRQLRR